MKRIIAAIGLIALALGANAQNVPMAAFDQSTGTLLAPTPTNFVRRNVLNQQGITRQVDTIADLNVTGSPYRSGEHVLVIDAGTFGNGGPVLFFHDSGSSDPTNTTDTVVATPGRWKAKRVFGSIPAFSEITSKPTTLAGYGITNASAIGHGHAFSELTSTPATLSGYGITNALPLAAGSNSPLTGALYAPLGIVLGTNVLVTNWPSTSSGGIGGIGVNGGTNLATNAVSSPLLTAVRTNGDFAFTITSTTGSGGTVVLSDSPSISGTWQFDGLSANVFQATNLNVATNAIGTLTAGSATITNELTASNITSTASALFASQTNTGTAGFGGPVLVGTTNLAQKIAQIEDLMVFTIMLGSELSPTTLTTNATRFVPGRKGVNWESTTDYNRGFVTIPVKCELVRAVWDLRNAVSASPSGSNIVWYARVNNTTDNAIHTNTVFDASFYSTNSGAISVSLNAGDTLAIKYATPAWLSTAPQPGGPVMLYFKPRL